MPNCGWQPSPLHTFTSKVSPSPSSLDHSQLKVTGPDAVAPLAGSNRVIPVGTGVGVSVAVVVAVAVDTGVAVRVGVGVGVSVGIGLGVGVSVREGDGVAVGGIGVGVHVGVAGVTGPRSMINSSPTRSNVSVFPLAAMMASTVVPYFLAIEDRVSPAITV